MCAKHDLHSHNYVRAQSCPTLWTVAYQSPLSMAFSRQVYWNGLPFHSPGYLPNRGIKSASLAISCIGRRILYHCATWEALLSAFIIMIVEKEIRSHLFSLRVLSSLNFVQPCFYGQGFPGGSDGKESACNAGDPASIPGSGRYPREGNGYPLQYSCLENSVDRRAWWATVYGGCKESDVTG